MREILKASGHKVVDYHGKDKFTPEQKKRAKIALNVFITRLRTYMTLYASFSDKAEAIVFSGGIGERSPVIRNGCRTSLWGATTHLTQFLRQTDMIFLQNDVT